MSKLKVLNVIELTGSQVNSIITTAWKQPMQLVFTNVGMFIDGMPGKGQFSNPKGHDWSSEIGRSLDSRHFRIKPVFQNPLFQWINTK